MRPTGAELPAAFASSLPSTHGYESRALNAPKFIKNNLDAPSPQSQPAQKTAYPIVTPKQFAAEQ
jgi:hypothetical protein